MTKRANFKFINKDDKNIIGKNIIQFENENKDSCLRICEQFKELNCEASEKIEISIKDLIANKISLNFGDLKNILNIKHKNKLVSHQSQKIPGGITKKRFKNL